MTTDAAVTTQALPVNGIDLHVTTAGSGAPVLLLHGLTVNATFEDQEIAQLAREFRVIAPDLRGHGRSTRPPSYTLADHVHDMLALLDALGVERTAVLGTSMGSYVAQSLAVAAPDRITKLVLVVSRAHGDTSATARYLADHADEVAGMSAQEQQLWVAQRMFAPDTGDDVRTRAFEWFLDQARQGLTLTPEQAQAANDALLGFDVRDALPSLHVPTLVVSGLHDVLNSPADGQEIADLLPDARFVVFERSGHMLPREEPDHLGELAREFLADRT